MERFSKRMIAAAVLAAAVFAAGPTVALADIIELRDGTRIVGTMGRQGDQMVITRTEDGKKFLVEPGQVREVTLSSTLTPAEKAENAWKQLQRELSKLNKLEDVIAGLEKFDTENGRSPAAEKAHNAAVSYKLLLTQDPVKFRGTWVARSQVEALTRLEQDQAKGIVATYRSGKLKEAMDQSRELLKTSPQNPLVLTVAGLASYRLNQLPQAREFFTRLVEVNETSVLGQNNLGVVAFQLQKPLDGLGYYAKGLQAGPENRLLLDNIVEALAAAEPYKTSPIFVALQRQFLQAETTLEAKFAKDGLFRYGSTWVTQQQRDRLVASRTALKSSLDAMEAQYAQAARTLENIDARIRQARSDVDAAVNEYNTWAAQTSGAYYDAYAYTRRDLAQGDLERARRRLIALEDQRTSANDSIVKLKVEAAKLKTSWTGLEKDQIAGVQRIMDLGDEELVPPPTAIGIPPIVEKPAETERPARVPVEQIPQQTTTVEPPVPMNNTSNNNYGNTYGGGGFGTSIQTGNFGGYGAIITQPTVTVIQSPPITFGGGGGGGGKAPAPQTPPVFVIGGGQVGGNIVPNFGPSGPGLPMFTPGGLPRK